MTAGNDTNTTSQSESSSEWKFGDSVCDFNEEEYSKEVESHIFKRLRELESLVKNKIWNDSEIKTVSKNVGIIAGNMRTNWCKGKEALDNALSGPISRLVKGETINENDSGVGGPPWQNGVSETGGYVPSPCGAAGGVECPGATDTFSNPNLDAKQKNYI
jgi:hypothetical protein